MSLAKSSFIPDSCLQGAEIPIHVIWNPKEDVEIKISYPSDIMDVQEVYNVKKEDVKFEQERLFLLQFEVNGYVGLLLRSRMCENPSMERDITIRIQSKSGITETVKQKILLFRPQIVAIDKPSMIMITASRSGDPILQNKIKIMNMGKGTAIANVKISEGSDIILRAPSEIEEFIEKFYTSLVDKLHKVKEMFPQFAKLTDDFVKVTEFAGGFTKEFLGDLNRVMSELSNAFECNYEFFLAFAEAVMGAYLSSIPRITEIHSFIEYLKSIATEKVIFYSAVNLFEVAPGSNKLKAELTVTDLALNYYEPIDISLEIELSASSILLVPLYSLFQVVPRRCSI